MPSIMDLQSIIAKLPGHKRDLVERFYTVHDGTGKLKVPKSMKAWATKQFGSVEALESQSIITVHNNYTFTSAGFNALRANRPLSTKQEVDLKEYEAKDVFVKPLKSTPADTFGRIKGKHCVTASNVAKYDAVHGLVIFKKFNPLDFTLPEVKDYASTAQKWFKKAHKANPHAFFPCLTWNCLFKAAASLAHGHMQTLLFPLPPGRAAFLNSVVKTYGELFGHYYDDLFKAHNALGLGFSKGSAKGIVELTPPKEKGVLLWDDTLSSSLISAVYAVLDAYRSVGVESFNVFVTLKPVKPYPWSLPVLVNIVDRGALSNKTTDVGATELIYQHAVIASDPYKVIASVKKKL